MITHACIHYHHTSFMHANPYTIVCHAHSVYVYVCVCVCTCMCEHHQNTHENALIPNLYLFSLICTCSKQNTCLLSSKSGRVRERERGEEKGGRERKGEEYYLYCRQEIYDKCHWHQPSLLIST